MSDSLEQLPQDLKLLRSLRKETFGEIKSLVKKCIPNITDDEILDKLDEVSKSLAGTEDYIALGTRAREWRQEDQENRQKREDLLAPYGEVEGFFAAWWQKGEEYVAARDIVRS